MQHLKVWSYNVPGNISLNLTELIEELQFTKQTCQQKTFKWLQLDSSPQPLSSWKHTQPFSQNGQTIELCCQYLSVRCIWLYVLIMSRTRFRVNPRSIVAWMSRNSLLKAGTKTFRLRDTMQNLASLLLRLQGIQIASLKVNPSEMT